MISLDEFLHAPASVYKILPKVLLPFDGENKEEIIRLSAILGSIDDRCIFYKKRLVKKILALIFKDIKIDIFTPKTLAVTAYMNDTGSVSVSVGCYLKLSSPAFLIVFFHELAHLLMSICPEYSDLKSLNREFIKKYGTEASSPLSPIEMIADQISIYLLEERILPAIKKKKARSDAEKRLAEQKHRRDTYIETVIGLDHGGN